MARPAGWARLTPRGAFRAAALSGTFSAVTRLPPPIFSARTALAGVLVLLAGCFDFSSLNAKSKDAGEDGAEDAARDAGIKDAAADARNRPDACSDAFVTDGGKPRKRAFLTSQKYKGNLGGIEGADEKCQELAEAAGQCGEWRAFLSDSTTRAHDHAITNEEATYERLDGVVVAESRAQFDEASFVMGPGLLTDIDVDETGARPPGDGTATGAVRVWTGTRHTGTEEVNPPFNCADWTSSEGTITGTAGYARNSDGDAPPNKNWLTQNDRQCDLTARLYCFEQ